MFPHFLVAVFPLSLDVDEALAMLRQIRARGLNSVLTDVASHVIFPRSRSVLADAVIAVAKRRSSSDPLLKEFWMVENH
jgi:hypothetical protein